MKNENEPRRINHWTAHPCPDEPHDRHWLKRSTDRICEGTPGFCPGVHIDYRESTLTRGGNGGTVLHCRCCERKSGPSGKQEYVSGAMG